MATKDALEMMEKKYGRMTFARSLKAWRRCEEASQNDFAKKLGISVQSLCDLEKGRRIPSPKRAAKIARKLQVSETAWILLALRDTLYSEGFKFDIQLKTA